MEQLLKITSVPMQYQLKVDPARLEMKNGTAGFELKREKGGLRIEGQPIRLKVDTFQPGKGVSTSIKSSTKEYAEKGRQAALEATAEFAKEGRILLTTKNGEGAETLNRIFEMRQEQPQGDFKLSFVPSEKTDLNWEGPELSIEYSMDKLNFDWNVEKGNIEFIPGNIEMVINEYPGVKIEYMGEPLYVPPSVAERFGGSHVDVKI